MQYWGEMQTKWGFGDGESYPAGVEILRDVYMKTVNRLAELYGSQCRYVPYDRMGWHNFCFLLLVSKEWYENHYLPKQKPGEEWSATHEADVNAAKKEFDVQEDKQMIAAVTKAKELEIDSYLEVRISLSPDFDRLMKKYGKKILRVRGSDSNRRCKDAETTNLQFIV